MIQVTIERDRNDQHILQYSLLGHANFAERGEDIVCAGVSAVAFGTVNAIEALLNVELDCVTDERDGRFEVDVPQLADEITQQQLQLLLESMVVMLNTIQETYGKYVQIKVITR